MEIRREEILGEGFTVPCVTILPEDAVGAAVIVHGYGGSKEEQLGLAWRLALCGAAAFAVDIRGHGENMHTLDGNALDDLERAIEYARDFGKVAAVGHSMGGRLALVSSADYRIGISPSLGRTFHEGIHEVMGAKRSYRVIEPSPDTVFDMMRDLPAGRFESDSTFIVYGQKDIPEIFQRCQELESQGVPAVMIDNALHHDIYTLEETFEVVCGKVGEWFEG